MRLIKLAIKGIVLGLLLSLWTQILIIVTKDIKFTPTYHGVDSKIAPYVNEYIALAKAQGITFSHKVKVGFRVIAKGNIVGLTHYELFFREIDVDSAYWQRATVINRTVLVWHELSHAYCYRDHDFGNGELYPMDEKSLAGTFPDHCPLSIMHPFLFSDDCFIVHYNQYVTEMFNRCNVY